MARVHPFQTNFTAGELTPKLAGQVDFKKYNNGVETMENMTVLFLAAEGWTSLRREDSALRQNTFNVANRISASTCFPGRTRIRTSSIAAPKTAS